MSTIEIIEHSFLPKQNIIEQLIYKTESKN